MNVSLPVTKYRPLAIEEQRLFLLALVARQFVEIGFGEKHLNPVEWTANNGIIRAPCKP